MGRAIGIRFGHALFSLLVLATLVFGMVRITGDPLQLILPDTASPADFARYRAILGLDKPLYEQYLIFLGDVAQGSLGDSIRLRKPVSDLIVQRLPATLALGLSALALTIIVGIPLGVYAAAKRGGKVDRFARGIAAVGQSAPSFWIGLILILVFAVHFKVLPAGGFGGPANLILPSIVMAWAAIAGLTRLVRSSMIEVLDTDYIKFLRIKGVPENVIIWKHGLRNAGLTALTFIGVITAGMLTGSVIAETVFVWPGMGQLMSQAIAGRDYPVVQGVLLVFAVVYIVINLVVDLLYAVLNPRLR